MLKVLFVVAVVGAPPEAIDVVLGVRNRGVAIRPGEADFHGRKQHAVDGNRAEIGAADTGVLKSLAGFEGFNVKAVVDRRHNVVPEMSRSSALLEG